jgi:tripartite-type tricarboxylate transporter receptor subunit TctC
MRSLMQTLGLAALAMLCLAPAASLAADPYPTKTISMVVPYSPGGATDVIGRVLAQSLQDALGKPVIVENRAGAGGNIGAQGVARAQPDGYTLLMGALTSHSIIATLEKDTLRYNLEKDLVPISIVGTVPLVFVVTPSLPAKTLKELIEVAKAKPGTVTFASSGPGAPQRMAAELFARRAGVELVHVPYKGSGPAMTDLVGGQVMMMVETVPAAQPFIKSGKLRALAVATRERISMLPDIPSAAEAGLPDFEVSSMFGVLAPAKTPKPIVDRLNSELVKILQNPEVKEKMLQQGVIATSTTPDQAAERIRAEITMWARVIKDANIKATD